MQISFKRQFLFVANTKTASTAIETALAPEADIVRDGTPARKHTPLRDALDIFRPELQRRGQMPLFKFGVMRDPVDWIISWYRYRLGNAVDAPLPSGTSFADFWRAKDWNIERPGGKGKFLQRDMFCDPGGRVLADVIIPYHALAGLFAEICALLGFPGQLSHANVSALQTSAVLSEDLLAEMRRFYADDYALFDRLDDINAVGMDKLRHRAHAA